MVDRLDELYARWRRNPDAASTAALCDALRGSGRADLVDVVGSHASQLKDVHALIAAARMYTESGRLDAAQAALVAAGGLAPRDGDVYRWLGEVLLRRGDAQRAEKVLERALQFAATDEGASSWLDHARALIPTQRTSGMGAVAKEVERTLGASASAPLALSTPEPEPEDSDDLETMVFDRASPSTRGLPSPPHPPPASVPALVRPPFPSDVTRDLARMPYESEIDPLDYDGALSGPVAMQTGAVEAPPAWSASPSIARPATIPFGAPAAVTAEPAPAFGAPVGGPPPSSARLHREPARRAPEPPIPQSPLLAPARPTPQGGTLVPEPRDVLDALQIAGVFEPDGAVRPDAKWEQAEKPKRRVASFATLVSMAVLFVGGAAGTLLYVTDRRAKQHIESEALLAKIDADLRASDATLLEPAERSLARAFDLESRSPHAALTWVRERAMVGLLKGGENLAFEDATQRAKDVGVPEWQIAFAFVASFLFQGDTAGAASTLAKWDAIAERDPYYQLLAGATFERAGDARAIERYEAAAKLDPELFIARVLLARATAVDGDPRRAAEIAKELRDAHATRPETAAVVALAWARDPLRGDPPPEVKELAEKELALPAGLQAVPHAARAMLALDQHEVDKAKPALQRALGLADTPGMASWLGGLALSAGDEALARKAALAAVSYSAVYPPARVLAARVALLGARLDEALKAAEDLPPASPDVAVITAAVAYEKLDPERMSVTLEAIPDDARKLPFVAPLLRGQALLAGRATGVTGDALVAAADDDAPWADLVAMDQALDSGHLASAAKIAEAWSADIRPLRAHRLARLARYQGKPDDADRLSKAALEGGTVTARVLAERAFSLVAAGKPGEAVALFKTHPSAGGAATKWLRAYAFAANNEADKARSAIASEDPPKDAALPVRIYAVMAYGALKDARHGRDLAKNVVADGFVSPDVAAAAGRLGVKLAAPAPAPARRGRRR